MNLFENIRERFSGDHEFSGNKKLKRGLLNALPFWVAAFISGAVAVFYAKLFSWAEETARFMFHLVHGSIFIIAPACFVLAWWLVQKFAPFSCGSGIPQVTASIELSNPKQNHKVNSRL